MKTPKIFLGITGELPPKEENSSTPSVDPEIALEELRAKHMLELQELQLQHQRQLGKSIFSSRCKLEDE